MHQARIRAAPALIVVNPRASRLADASRRAGLVRDAVAATRSRTGHEPLVVEGSHERALAALADHAAEATASPAEDVALVVAMGGDGTIREAAAAVAGRPVALAMIPGGTGNVLATSLGLGGTRTAVETLTAGTPRAIDLGRVRWGPPGAGEPTGESVFLVACGSGIDARIMARAHGEWKRRLRFGAYVLATLRELVHARPVAFRIVADGRAIETHGYVALVANTGELVPGVIGPRRRIDPTDGWLDLLVVGGRRRLLGLWGAAGLVLRADEQHGDIVRRAIREVRIETDPPEPIEVDGDPLPPGWLEATIEPGALTILGGS